MIAAYELIATPLQGRIGAPILLGSFGWSALGALAVGFLAVAALAVRDRLTRHPTNPPAAADAPADPPLAA